jgi:hypothetical protein
VLIPPMEVLVLPTRTANQKVLPRPKESSTSPHSSVDRALPSGGKNRRSSRRGGAKKPQEIPAVFVNYKLLPAFRPNIVYCPTIRRRLASR